ncbi:hypothetical protein [Candidatus Pyrohabitans sp.]
MSLKKKIGKILEKAFLKISSSACSCSDGCHGGGCGVPPEVEQWNSRK